MVRLVRVSPGPRREKCGAWSAKERLADMEVSRNERFKLEVGLAEGRADYRTKIVYQRNDRAVNKKKLKSNRNQISFEYVLFLLPTFAGRKRYAGSSSKSGRNSGRSIYGTQQWIRRRRHSWWQRARRLQ